MLTLNLKSGLDLQPHIKCSEVLGCISLAALIQPLDYKTPGLIQFILAQRSKVVQNNTKRLP